MSGRARIGILGAGQLGLMLAQAARDLDISAGSTPRATTHPAASMGPVLTGAMDDEARLARFADGLDVVTYEWENMPVRDRAADRRARPRPAGNGARSKRPRTG